MKVVIKAEAHFYFDTSITRPTIKVAVVKPSEKIVHLERS